MLIFSCRETTSEPIIYDDIIPIYKKKKGRQGRHCVLFVTSRPTNDVLLVSLNSVRKKKSWDKNLRFFLILFSLVLLCRKFRQRSWNICFDGFLLFLFLGLCWGSRRWGLEIKSELSEWDPVALVCVSSTHTNVGRLSPQIIQTKEDEKKSPQKEKKEGRISTRPRARFRALVVSCHLTWTNTHTPYPNDWSPVCFPTGGNRSSLFCFLLLLLGFLFFYSFINHRLSKTKKKGQDCCCFHLKSARSFPPSYFQCIFFLL